jgi:hypothetical protein
MIQNLRVGFQSTVGSCSRLVSWLRRVNVHFIQLDETEKTRGNRLTAVIAIRMSALFKKCCPQKDPETEYNSDDEKGEEPEVQPDFTKQLEANEGFCRIKKKGRRPRDCPCLVVFLVFLLGLGYVTYHAFARGDPRRLYMPTDYLGRVCGADNTNTAPNWLKLPLNKDCINADKNPKNTTAADLCEEAVKPFKTDLTSRRFLWFMSITDPIRFGGVCVSYCPGAHNKSAVEKEPFCPPELDQTAVNNTIFSKFGFTPNPICTYERADRANLTFPVTDEEQFLQTVLPYGSILRRCIPGAATSTVKQEFQTLVVFRHLLSALSVHSSQQELHLGCMQVEPSFPEGQKTEYTAKDRAWACMQAGIQSASGCLGGKAAAGRWEDRKEGGQSKDRSRHHKWEGCDARGA